MRAADVITESLDSLPRPENAVDRAYTDLIRSLYKDRNAVIVESTGSRNQMQDYYAMWVHQIKVPISAMHMLLQDQEKSSPMNVQLFRIEQYVSMALSYVRLESEQTDYVIKQYSLDSIVKQSVRKYAPLFISKKTRLDIEDTDLIVNTDEKWLGFVVGQILSNSLKYTSSGSISISYEAPKTLVMAGIHVAFDFPFIFRVMTLMNLFDKKLFALCTGGCFLAFTVFYVVVYLLTSRLYYRIVRK